MYTVYIYVILFQDQLFEVLGIQSGIWCTLAWCTATVHALKKLTFYGRTTPTATGVLRSRYYRLAAGCKLTSGHYNRER